MGKRSGVLLPVVVVVVNIVRRQEPIDCVGTVSLDVLMQLGFFFFFFFAIGVFLPEQVDIMVGSTN